jgi:16S rRNA (guanine966-N2)-methyltransferase
MRVVAGDARGRRLQAPPGRATRPTSDRVREAIFDVLGSLLAARGRTLEGARVADLFAGSGALGIEALSRGAASAVFVESDRAAVATIRANLDATGFAGSHATVVATDVARWLRGADHQDLVLCDPPYRFSGWSNLLTLMAPVGGLPIGGLAVFESGTDLDLGPGWESLREKHYGGTVVTVAQPTGLPGSPTDRKGDA